MKSFLHSITRGTWITKEWGDSLSVGAEGAECQLTLSSSVDNIDNEKEYIKEYVIPFFHSSLSSFPLICSEIFTNEDTFCRIYNSRETLCDDNIRSFISFLPGGGRSKKGFFL
jgi:hypothetical protein